MFRFRTRPVGEPNEIDHVDFQLCFDICGLKQGGNWYGAFDPRWSSNPFHPDNNINDLGLPKDHALGKDRFFNLKNAKLRAIQEAFVDRLLSEFGGHGHIIFNVCNEYDGPFDWQEHWVRRIKARRPDRLVAVNNHDGKVFLPASSIPRSICSITIPAVARRPNAAAPAIRHAVAAGGQLPTTTLAGDPLRHGRLSSR